MEKETQGYVEENGVTGDKDRPWLREGEGVNKRAWGLPRKDVNNKHRETQKTKTHTVQSNLQQLNIKNQGKQGRYQTTVNEEACFNSRQTKKS